MGSMKEPSAPPLSIAVVDLGLVAYLVADSLFIIIVCLL